MFVSNGELFIKLNVAARAFYYYDLCFCDPSNEHFEHLETSLDLYIFINGIGNILTPKNSTIDNILKLVPKKINGMCVVEVNHPSYELATYHCVQPTINLKTSPFVESINQELIGYSFKPIDNYINYDNYFGLSYVQLTKFLKHAKEVGVTIDAKFLEEVIINDNKFSELKRLSKQQANAVFNLNQAANSYLPYFNGVLIETIIEGCALASARYDRINQKKKSPQEIVKAKLNDISELFSETKVTNETIEQFKKTLPDVWREALFNKPSRVIEDLKNNNIDSNGLSTREKDNLYKTVGLLSLAIAKKNPNRFGDINNINANQIYKTLLEFLPVEPIGLGDKTVRTKVKQGVELLRDA
jgi:hypothetical protein